MRYVSLLLLVAALCPVTATATASGMNIERDQSGVTIAGVISSSGHETILRETLERDFPGITHSLRLETAGNLPAGWSLLTDLALRALASTRSGAVTIGFDSIRFTGYSGTPEDWYAALERLERQLPAGVALESEVSVVAPERSLAAFCRAQFDAALRTARIRFASGSTALSSSSFAALDALLELAADCPTARIRVRGAGDSPFGAARAQAVADYLAGRGLAAARVSAGVAGGVPVQTVDISVDL